MFLKRTETIEFREFMSGEYKYKGEDKKTRKSAILKATGAATSIVIASKVAIPALLVTLPIAIATNSIPAAASAGEEIAIPAGTMSDAVKSKIIHAFDPLVDLMVALSLPIAGIMVTAGSLLVMIGQKDAGYKLILNSALGYVLVQLSPMFIDLLAGVGAAI